MQLKSFILFGKQRLFQEHLQQSDKTSTGGLVLGIILILLLSPYKEKWWWQKLPAFHFGFEAGGTSHSFSKSSGDIKSDVAILCLNASLAHGSLKCAR